MTKDGIHARYHKDSGSHSMSSAIPELRTQSKERRDLSASQFTVVDKGILWKVAVTAIGEPMLVEVGGERTL
jgi:hypothetical protein